MTVRRVLIACEGRHESGDRLDVALRPDSDLPALPQLVHRVLSGPAGVEYTCMPFTKVRHVPGKGHKWGRKVMRLILLAKARGFDAAVVLIDRDRKKDRERLIPLQEGRNGMTGPFPPCAVGTAVETFDAWMICDENAAEKAGGDKTKCRPEPENLDGKEGTGKHPKDISAIIFGSGENLGGKYAVVARYADLNLLSRRCPQGFTPFKQDIESRIDFVQKPQ
jgi:hypothetical protein